MKKFIKNTLLTFVIIFTILNLVFYVFTAISRFTMIKEVLTEYIGENRDVEASAEVEKNTKEAIEEMKYIYGEDVPATALFMFQNYTMGMSSIIYIQTTLLIVTSILSIVIGIILSLTKQSKAKELLCFILGGITFILVLTVYMCITKEYEGMNAIEAIFETIGSFGIYYIVGYLVVFVYRYCKNKKSVEELNKEIEKKNK